MGKLRPAARQPASIYGKVRRAPVTQQTNVSGGGKNPQRAPDASRFRSRSKKTR